MPPRHWPLPPHWQAEAHGVAVGSQSAPLRSPPPTAASSEVGAAASTPSCTLDMEAQSEVGLATYPSILEHWCCEFVQTMDCSLVLELHLRSGGGITYMNILIREFSEKTLHCQKKLMNGDYGASWENECQIRKRRETSSDCHA